MKYFLITIAGLLILTSSVFAQKKDHLLIAKYESDEAWVPNDNNSSIQEINNSNNSSKSNSRSFLIQVGASSYNFYDPSLYGEHVIIESNGAYIGTLSGFKDLAGVYVKSAFFFNENIGLSLDLAFHYGQNNNFIENDDSYKKYKTSADLNFQRIGFIGRFVGEEYPIKLSIGSGIGYGSFSAYYQIITNTSGVESQLDFDGEVSFPMVYFQTEIIIPIFKGLFLFSEYEYSIAWSDDFSLIHNNGSEYNEIKYKYPGLGGNSFRFGLGYEF